MTKKKGSTHDGRSGRSQSQVSRNQRDLGHPAPGLTIIKTSASYFACVSPATTAATLSSTWFMPSS